MAASRHLTNALIIISECMTLRDGVLVKYWRLQSNYKLL